MKKGEDGIWRTVGGIPVSKRQQTELDGVEIIKKPMQSLPQNEAVHTLYIVNSKYPPSPIQEAKCRIVVTEKISWAEPIMPLRGKLRTQKRFMLGAFAFYTMPQAEKKKVLLLIQASRAGYRQMSLAKESRAQLECFKETGKFSHVHDS